MAISAGEVSHAVLNLAILRSLIRNYHIQRLSNVLISNHQLMVQLK